MTTVVAILNHPLMRQVGWTLLHSLWQGALIGLVFFLLRTALRRRSANTRYLAGCACLVLLAVAPVLTFIHESTPAPAGGGLAYPASGPAHAVVPMLNPGSLATAFHGGGAGWPMAGGSDFLTRLTPALVLVWLLGVMFCSARLTRSCWSAQGIRTRDNEPVDAAWLETLDELRHRLGVSRPVRLLKSALVEVPTVIGWFRPVILLPAATLSGLTPGQLEAILAHELAHVRRLDYLVNAFQCLVETLMFYHPVAWWISRCIREERENCCDDLVVEVCGDRLEYARALVTLEGFRAELPELAFAASGGSLLARIRRLVGADKESGGTTVREAGGLALLGVGLVLIVLGVRMLLSPASYQSTARMRIESDQTQAHKQIMDEFHSLVNPTWHPPATPVSYDPNFIQTHFEVIQSELVLGKVIEDLDLNHAWGKKYANGERLKTSETIALLKGRIDLRPVRNTSLIEVRVYSENADEAARIANAIADAYKAHRQERRLQMSKGAVKALEQRFAEQEEKVRQAQKRVQALRTELNISDTMASGDDPSPLMTADTLRKLEALRIENKAAYVRQVSLLDRLKAMGKDLGPEGLAQAIPTAASDNLLTSLLEQNNLAEQRLVTLEKDYGPTNAEVIKCKALADDLHNKIKSRVDGVMLGLEARALSLSNSLYNLEKEVALATTNDVIRANQTRPYFEAKRNLDELHRFRQILDIKIASEKLDLEPPNAMTVDIIDRAIPAIRPASPRMGIGLALIALGALFDIAGLLLVGSSLGGGPEPRPT